MPTLKKAAISNIKTSCQRVTRMRTHPVNHNQTNRCMYYNLLYPWNSFFCLYYHIMSKHFKWIQKWGKRQFRTLGISSLVNYELYFIWPIPIREQSCSAQMRLTYLLRQVSSQAALLCLEFWESKNMMKDYPLLKENKMYLKEEWLMVYLIR